MTHNLPLKTIQDDGWVVDGVSFMKVCLKWFDYGYKDEENGKNTCPLFKWENQDLLLDNSNVVRKKLVNTGDLYTPHVAFNKHLALKMGWFKQNPEGVFEIGPNLVMNFPTEKSRLRVKPILKLPSEILCITPAKRIITKSPGFF